MPRSPSDATRFTATGPYVSNKPSSATLAASQPKSTPTAPLSPGTSSIPRATHGTRLNVGGAAPEGETAQQKIARLRKAAALARQGNEGSFDRVVRIGRRWADRAHRFTALSLLGLTVVSGIVATAGITDMLMHNRRRRNEWLAEQQAKTARDLAIAKRAQSSGEATEDQILLINRERAAAEAEEAKKNRPGVFKRATSWFSSGLSEVEQKGGKLGGTVGAMTESVSTGAQHAAESLTARTQSIAAQAQGTIEDHTRHSGRPELRIGVRGGPLDQHAQAAANAVDSTVRSWTSWFTRR